MKYQLRLYTSGAEYEGIDIESFTNSLRKHQGQESEGKLEYSLQMILNASGIEEYAHLFTTEYEKISIMPFIEEVSVDEEGDEEVVQLVEGDEIEFSNYTISRISRSIRNNGKEYLLIEFEK